jgi:3-hydroxyisobutyrate dehydrogenase-like beta-hydroxyacid dehydrogenase
VSRALCVAVLGLGEAGSEIARDLVAAGAVVRGYDPAVPPAADVVACTSEADAVAGAALVLSVNSAADAVQAARSAAPALAEGSLWADLNTAAPSTKTAVAGALAGTPAVFTDVALMSPVPGRGLRTPMLASGPGAARCAEVLRPLGAQVEVLGDVPGAAATRKLVRSVFYKGLAAAVVEALAAARAAGCESALRADIADELARATAGTVDVLEQGSLRHALRRSHEMAAAAQLLEELGVAPRIAAASRDQLAELAVRGAADASPADRRGS